MLVEFVSVVDAVRCAVEIQRGMRERNAGIPADRRIEFRTGINVGDIISDGNDIFGDGVNVAARLEALAEPGGILVSRNVYDQVRDKLSFGFEDMGEQIVKNIARPIGIHRVSFAENAAPAVVQGAQTGHERGALAATQGPYLLYFVCDLGLGVGPYEAARVHHDARRRGDVRLRREGAGSNGGDRFPRSGIGRIEKRE
jgi:adenylate cyclase